jgi:hypothetical protein
MRFFQTLAAGAALVASALALTIDTFPSSVEAGKTYTITYSPKDNTPTTFILRKGLSTNLDTVETLTTTATGGSFQWTVDSKYADAPNYALEIRQQGVTPNFSGQFPLTGGEGTESSSSASASATASSSGSITRSASTSASASPSASSNGTTVSSATLTRTTGTTRPSATSGGVPEATTNAAAPLAPVAAFAGLFAAFAYLA